MISVTELNANLKNAVESRQNAKLVAETIANITADLPASTEPSTEESSIRIRAEGTPNLMSAPLSRKWPDGPCYIAGPMRGIAEFNFPAFFKAEAQLTADGAEVGLNPARYDHERGCDWKGKTGFEPVESLTYDYRPAMGHGLAYVHEKAAWVCAIPGWRASRGSLAEIATAKSQGKPVLELATGRPIEEAPGWLCEQAAQIVGGARNGSYGPPEMNFERIGLLWEAWDCVLATVPEGSVKSTVTVAIRNILQKLARIAETPTHTDSWRDIAGYADCGARCAGCDPAK